MIKIKTLKITTPEDTVKKECIDWLKKNGWFHFNIRQGKHCYKGISDRIAMKNGVVLFIEFKSSKGKLSDDQKKFKKNVDKQNCYYIIARSYKDIEKFIKDLEND
jgi:hypothetical protein